MSDIKRTHDDFVQELAENYGALGYEKLRAEDFRRTLGFEPDLVFRRNDEITIVEVKRDTDRARWKIAVMRETAEQHGYRFEYKTIPETPKRVRDVDGLDKVSGHLARARQFLLDGNTDLSLILSWIAIETCTRRLAAAEGIDLAEVDQTGEVLRIAIDMELYHPDEVGTARAIVELRHRLVHGFRTEVDRDLAETALAMADRFVGFARQADRHEPVDPRSAH